MKEEEFLKKLQQTLEEEEKLRIPIAQGLPWTTDEPQVICQGNTFMLVVRRFYLVTPYCLSGVHHYNLCLALEQI